MSPRGKAKAKKNTEENGSEKRVRESRNVKAASYKDFSDSEDDKPVRRRKKDSDSEVSLSEEEKPKKVVAKGRGRAAPRSKKQESESDEASEFNSDESSGGDSRKKKKKPARKPVRSLRTPQRASYKDLSDSEDESNNEEEDDEESSEKEDKRAGGKRKRGSPPKKVGKKSKKNESSGSEDEELDEEEEEEVEDEEENEEDGEGKGKADKPSSKKKAVDETSSEPGNKSKGESEKKVEKSSRPEHELSEEEDGDEEMEKEQPVKSDSKEVKDAGNDTKKRGRPPKNAAKVEEDEDDDAEEEEPLPKKAKAGEKALLNKTESNYASIDFSSEAKTKDGKPWNFKISSWNVAGLKAWVKKNGIEYIKREDPDIICLQETKCSEKKLPPESKVEGYHAYWHSGEKEGYAGVAILSKTKPLDVKFGIEKTELDNEGRVITAEYEKFYLVNVYVPNAGQGLKSLPRRLEWDPAFRAYLKSLDEKKPVILCGDLNVAHNEIDLANPKTNTKSAGFTPQEREGMTELLKQGFVDTFRSLYPDKTGAYSFWTYMSNARSRNVGWRLDYFITSERFVPQICDNVIRNEVFGSDHCPITLFANV